MKKIKEWGKSNSIKNWFDRAGVLCKNAWKYSQFQVILTGLTTVVFVADYFVNKGSASNAMLFILVGWQIANIYERDVNRQILEKCLDQK